MGRFRSWGCVCKARTDVAAVACPYCAAFGPTSGEVVKPYDTQVRIRSTIRVITFDYVGYRSCSPHPVCAGSLGEVQDELYKLREEIEKFCGVSGEVGELRRGLTEASDRVVSSRTTPKFVINAKSGCLHV
eukprot:4446658-Amphidinium_carterae.1